MTRIQQALAAAAILVAGGATLTLALHDAGQALDPPGTCVEWCTATARARDSQWHSTFFVALQQGVTVPAAHGERVIGDCSGGECRIEPGGCGQCPVVYTYQLGALVNGWRLFRVRAPAYVAGSLKAWAAETPGAKFLGSFAAVKQACLAVMSPANCLAALQSVSDCWLLSTGDACRHGYLVRLTGPGDLEPLACPWAQVVASMDCEQQGGAPDRVLVEAQQVWADGEIDAASLAE